MDYQEGQRLQGSDGKVYVVSGGVPREEGATQPTQPTAQPGIQVVGTPRPKPPQLRQVGDSLGVVDDGGHFTPTYTPPPKAPEPKALSRISPNAAGGIQENLKTLRSIDAAIATLKGRPGSVGPGTGMLGDTFTQFNDPAGTDARASVGAVGAYKIHDLSGAAVSASESPRFVPFVPSVSDRPDVAVKKLQQFREALQGTLKEQMDFYSPANGYEPYSTPGAQDALTPPAPPQLTNEQLDAELKSKIQSGEKPAAIIQWLVANNQPITDDTIAAITANQGNPAPDVQRESQFAHNFKSSTGDLVEGAGDVVGLVANPLNAATNAALGTDLSTDFGASLRGLTGLPDDSPGLVKAMNTGGITALGGVGLARGAAPLLSGAGRAAADIMGAQPVEQVVGGIGAGASTEKARQMGLGPAGQFAAGVAGGGAGFAGSNAMARFGARVGAAPNALAEAATKHGVDLMPADVAGPVARRVTGAAAQAPFSAAPIMNQAKKTQAQIGDAVDRVVTRHDGEVLPADDAGESIRAAGKTFSRNQAARIGRVYDRAEERAKGVSIKPVGAVRVLDEQLARLGQLKDTNAPLIRDLEKLKGDLGNGIRVSGMRDARTALSQGVYDGKLRSGQEKAIYKEVIGALSNDIETGLRSAGRKDALNLFKIADKAWKDRVEYIDTVLEPVIGSKKSGEQILTSIEGMAKGKAGGVRRLSELMRELPDEQADNIRATIADGLGKATPGNQDDTGRQFSAGTFLTRWNQLSPKGKAALFGSGDLRQNLDEIAKIASATKQSGKYASMSNSPAGILSNVGIIASMAYANPKLAALAATAQYGTGRLMSSRRFTAWLARVPENPQAQTRYVEKLGQIAAAEPIIANDIASIQQYLSSASQRAAASPKDQTEQRR